MVRVFSDHGRSNKLGEFSLELSSGQTLDMVRGTVDQADPSGDRAVRVLAITQRVVDVQAEGFGHPDGAMEYLRTILGGFSVGPA